MISGDNKLQRFAAARECGYLCFKPKRTFYGNNHHQIRQGSASFFDEMKKGIGPHRPFAGEQPALIGRGKLPDRYGTGRKTQAEQAHAAGIQKQRRIALLSDRRKNPIPGKRYRTTAGKEPERSVLTSGSVYEEGYTTTSVGV